MWWLWLLIVALVCVIVAMEVMSVRLMRRLGARPPRSVIVLKVANVTLLVAALVFAAWVVLTRGW